MEVNWITVEEVSFFTTIWLIGFFVALFGSLGSATDKSLRISVFSSGVVGFLSLGCVALRVGDTSTGINGVGLHLFTAILIGATGPYHQKVLRYLLKKYGFLPDAKDED